MSKVKDLSRNCTFDIAVRNKLKVRRTLICSAWQAKDEMDSFEKRPLKVRASRPAPP